MVVNSLLPKTSPYYTSLPKANVNSPSTPASAIKDTLDLSAPARDPIGALHQLSPAARSEFLENLARLLQAGVVGIETLEVDGQPYQSFAATRFANPQLAGAPLYRNARL